MSVRVHSLVPRFGRADATENIFRGAVPKLTGLGHVYIWLQTLDAENYPVGPPRAYQLAYSEDLVQKVNEAMGRISEGEAIQGIVESEVALPEATSEALAEEIDAELGETRPGGSSGAGERITNFDPSMLSFDTEAAPITPAKSP